MRVFKSSNEHIIPSFYRSVYYSTTSTMIIITTNTPFPIVFRHSASYSAGTRCLPRPIRQADNAPLPSVVVKTEWIYTSTSFHFMMCTSANLPLTFPALFRDINHN
jgi:hypothetical protein